MKKKVHRKGPSKRGGRKKGENLPQSATCAFEALHEKRQSKKTSPSAKGKKAPLGNPVVNSAWEGKERKKEEPEGTTGKRKQSVASPNIPLPTGGETRVSSVWEKTYGKGQER